MAQIIMKDTGMMTAAGLTAAQYLASADYDPAFNDIVDTGQTFNVNWVPKRQIWFYFPTLNQFFMMGRRSHAIVKAMKSLFTEERWDEIEDVLEEQGPVEDVINRLDMRKFRRKLQRARTKVLITAAEITSIRDLLVHLANGP